jgi:hypothetical protein
LLVIPIAVRVRAPIPALLACLWGEEIFLHVPRKLLKVSRLNRKPGMLKHLCSNTKQTRRLSDARLRPVRALFKTPFQGSSRMFFKNIRSEICLEPCFPYA